MEDNLVKKRMIHRLILAALTASLIGNINFVFADDGKWIQTDNKWWYQKKRWQLFVRTVAGREWKLVLF